jgi:hypothetical protein
METIVSWLLWYILSYSTPNSSFFFPNLSMSHCIHFFRLFSRLKKI